MIAVDTSALIAILFREEEAELYGSLIQVHGRALIGVPTALEFRMVALGQSTAEVAREAAAMVFESPFELVPFGPDHLEAASDAFLRYGKGNHPAGLNFGDCMAYATAAVAGCPLLYKGNDFKRTRIPSVA